MRYLTTLCTLALFYGSLSIAAMNPSTVTVGLSKAYIPVGFDDNDRVQLAVEGAFHNTCYKVGPYAVKVNQADKTIQIQQQAYVYSGICLQMFVPFTQIVDLGIIESGNYTLVDTATKKSLGQVVVLHTNIPTADDFLYAPVVDSYVVSQASTGTNTLVVVGSFSDRCTDFEEIRVNYNESVIVVQPIVKHSENRECQQEKTRFLKTIELKKDLHGLHLLHVRAMNGQAINKMVDMP